MKLTTKILTAVTVLGLIMVLAGVIACVILFERAEITILNTNPYPCVVAVKYQSSPNTWQTLGWFKLGPGEAKTVKATFFRVKPEFFVAAESRDPGLLSWLIKDGDGVVYFWGTDISGHVPKNRDIDLAEVEDENVELEEITFGRVNQEDTIHILTDPLFQDAVLRNDGAELDEEEGFELIKEKATHLYDSLHRQKRFEETFNSESAYPFCFEFEMTDDPERGFMYLGVIVSNVRSHTLHGDQIQLQNGDRLIGIASGEDEPVTPIYASADAYLALHEHALDTENGGISKPLKFIVMRGKDLLQIESFYLFNPGFNWDDVSAGRAFFEGGLNSLTLGFWPWIVALFSDDPHATWKTTQRLGRLRQFHPEATSVGEIAGILAPTPTKFLKIGKGAWGGRLLSSTVVKGMSVELLRLAVYRYNTNFPAPQTKQSTANDLSQLFSSPLNIVEGLYEEGTEPTFKQRRTFGRTH